MLQNDAFIITMAYPETIVSHAEESYSKFLRYIFIGNKKYVRAGHAALVLIHKKTGVLEYHDFGRYITPSPDGRVRGRETDFELNFPIKANIKDDQIENLEEILKFLATNPKLTHGDGDLYASVNRNINYDLARKHITNRQNEGFIRYAAFIKDACNCARFVVDAIIASTMDSKIKKQLVKSKSFTPSTIGTVVIAGTENFVHRVTENKELFEFKGSVKRKNRHLFMDMLKGYSASNIGTTKPKYNDVKSEHAQWLGGIAAGAWFEIYNLGSKDKYRYRRISPYGNIDCDGLYKVDDEDFNIDLPYKFIHYSNCGFFNIKQGQKTFKFEYLEGFKA